MDATPGWTAFLRQADACTHGVQIYGDLDDLARSVAAFLKAGFDVGEPGLVVATPEHLERFEAELGAAGCDLQQVRRDGLLHVVDAEAMLERILADGYPSAAAVEVVVGGLLDELAARFPNRTTRVFGEMVDLLCARGRANAAVSLEELWNSLAWSRSFSLLCGYQLDVFDREAQIATLPEVCRTHSHVLPASDAGKLSVAVGQALEQVLGAARAGQVYALVGDQIRRERVPAPQLALMWVSANIPGLADRILASARELYLAPA
jgi:MEDS: MEthanogen/methylotroph, DcmR Sensory domain